MTDSSNESLWDGQPVNLARHIVTLLETYSKHVPAQTVSLVETGVIFDRSRIVVFNKLHALVRLSPSFNGLPTMQKPYSFDNPAPGAVFWRTAQDTFLADVAAEAAARNAAADTTMPATFVVRITTHNAPASAIDIDIDVPNVFAATNLELTDAEAKRYMIGSEELNIASRLLQSFLTNGISTPSVRRKYASDVCGLSLLRQLLDDRDRFSITFGTDFEMNYDEHRRTGLSDATAQTFLEFTETLTMHAAVCPASRRKEPSVLVTAILDAVHDLGSEIRTEVRGALRNAACPTDNLHLTIETIHMTLSMMEREAARHARNGAAKLSATPSADKNGDRGGSGRGGTQRRDPRKTRAGKGGGGKGGGDGAVRPKPWLERDWMESDGPCPHKDCKGSHWKIHCPLHPLEVAGVGQAKLARGVTELTNNEYCDGCTFDDHALSFHDLVASFYPDDAAPSLSQPIRACVATHASSIVDVPNSASVEPPNSGALAVPGTFISDLPDDGADGAGTAGAEPLPHVPPEWREMKLYLLLVGPMPGACTSPLALAPTRWNAILWTRRRARSSAASPACRCRCAWRRPKSQWPGSANSTGAPTSLSLSSIVAHGRLSPPMAIACCPASTCPT